MQIRCGVLCCRWQRTGAAGAEWRPTPGLTAATAPQPFLCMQLYRSITVIPTTLNSRRLSTNETLCVVNGVVALPTPSIENIYHLKKYFELLFCDTITK